MRTDHHGQTVEVVCAPLLPLPVHVAVEVMRGIDTALQRAGYTHVVLLTDGPHAGAIAATPPAEPVYPEDAWDDQDEEEDEDPRSGPPPAEEGAPTAH